MLIPLYLVLALLSVSVSSAQTTPPKKAPSGNAPIKIMILGTYHMANPGHDAVNMQVDDVLQPKRQRELEQTATLLLAFHPTKIAIEARASAPAYVWKSGLDPADLKTKRNEDYQLGERLALGAGLDTLYGVDNDGDFDLAPVKALDERATGGERVKASMGEIQQLAHDADEKQHTLTISQSLAWMNTPQAIKRNHDFYMNILPISNGDDQPAAKLDAEWYERNLRIWGKILQVAKPGDRILVVIGQGHAFWLRSLAEQMPGYRLVDPLPYLLSRGSQTP